RHAAPARERGRRRRRRAARRRRGGGPTRPAAPAGGALILALEVSGAEAVGYLASALVVLSLTMTSVVRLRTISLAGSIAFVVYGAMLGAVPILISNAVIAAINVWFLRSELGM